MSARELTSVEIKTLEGARDQIRHMNSQQLDSWMKIKGKPVQMILRRLELPEQIRIMRGESIVIG